MRTLQKTKKRLCIVLAALIAQGLYLYRRGYNELQNTMRLIVEPLGGARMGFFRFDGENGETPPEPPQRMDEKGGKQAQRDERRISEEGILVVFYDSGGDSYTLLSRETFLDADRLDEAVHSAAAQSERQRHGAQGLSRSAAMRHPRATGSAI